MRHYLFRYPPQMILRGEVCFAMLFTLRESLRTADSTLLRDSK